MCSQIVVKIKPYELSSKIKLVGEEPLDPVSIRVHGYLKTETAPVIVANERGDLVVREMCFSLCPSWSKEFPYPWSTYNARMERPKAKKSANTLALNSLTDLNTGKAISEFIYEVPTWRDVFSQGKTCLVPMTQAVESSYFGRSAGNILRFSQKSQGLFFSAGLWSQWKDKKTGEVKYTFSLITDHPYRFFFEHGHDRSIFVIDSSKQEEWLINKTLTASDRFKFLRQNRVSLDWEVEVERTMKSGWEKRKPTDKDLAMIEVWNG